jgi:serpin B
MRSYPWSALALAGALAACAESPTAPRPIDGLPRSLGAAEQEVVSGSNAFAFSLLRQAPERGGNVFVSPLSVSMALGMTMNGARGQTRDEMASTLGFGGMTPDEVNASYKSLTSLLLGLDRSTDVRLANSIWYRQGFPLEASFLDQSRASFGAQVAALDFGDPASVGKINDWVKQGTGGKIPSIVDQIASDEVLFLVNATYFKGSWVHPFDRSRTRDESFYRPGGAVTVRMMTSDEAPFGYARGPQWTAIDLPYGNTAFSMTVILPDSGVSARAVAASMDGAAWNALATQMHPIGTIVRMPRFRIEYGSDLTEALDRMGIHEAFVGGAADFTGMSAAKGHDMYVTQVQHKAFVEVNEEGTEAAAATSVGVGVTSLPPTITVNRPFLVAIRERFSGTILFLGRIDDPTA